MVLEGYCARVHSLGSNAPRSAFRAFLSPFAAAAAARGSLLDPTLFSIISGHSRQRRANVGVAVDVLGRGDGHSRFFARAGPSDSFF